MKNKYIFLITLIALLVGCGINADNCTEQWFAVKDNKLIKEQTNRARTV